MVEVALITLDYKPGFIKKFGGFNIVDELEVYNNFQTDSAGAISFNYDVLHSYANFIQNQDGEENVFIGENVSEILYDFKEISHKNAQDTVSEFLINIRSQIENCDDAIYCQLLEEYLKMPFNKSGFRSVSFEEVNSKKKKVLLLGDSFVYGMSASPFYNSFADILLSRGFIIYNTGINGTDPAQYYAVAKSYVEKIKPDIIIVNFSTASDLMLFEREPKFNEPHEHYTNAGFIESNPMGEYLAPQEAYDFYFDMIRIKPQGVFNFICSKFASLSLLYGVLAEAGILEHVIYTKYISVRKNISIEEMAKNSKIYFDRIQAIAEKNEIELINAVIPVKKEPFKTNKNFNDYFVDTISLNLIFGAQHYYYPKNLTINDYEEHGDHFNNKGAAKYATFLDSLINETLYEF